MAKAGLEYNTGVRRRVPINRNNLFYSEESFEFEREIGKCYIEQDMNQTVILYQVDNTSTNSDAIYGETSDSGVRYKTPVEIHVVYEIEAPELKAYDKSKNLGTYMQTGKLKFGVYQETLDEHGAEIKVGDYIGVQVNEYHMEYFTVVNDGRNNFDNTHSLYGVKGLYRSVECASVDQNEFNG